MSDSPPGALTDAESTTDRPAILVEWERDKRERDAAFSAKYGVRDALGIWHSEAPEAAKAADLRANELAFAAMYEQLTPQQRDAEAARLAVAAAAEPSGSYSSAQFAAMRWECSVGSWDAEQSVALGHLSAERSRIELQATQLAEAALGRCAYLGGFPDYPHPVPQCSCGCHIATSGNIHWQDRAGNPICGADWADVIGLRVEPTDRARERFTATRLAFLGPLGLAFKKQRREAMLRIKTASGEGLFIVHGYTPLQLEAQLTPLAACIGTITSDAIGTPSQLAARASALAEAHAVMSAIVARTH